MSEQTNAELIDEARQLIRHSSVSAPEHANMLGRLAAALEAAEQRADQAEATAEHLHDEDTREIVALTQERDALAAVVEKVRVFIERQSGWFRYRADPVSTVLATAPADALREVKAEAWDEGWSTAGAWQIAAPDTPYPWNPYRKEQS